MPVPHRKRSVSGAGDFDPITAALKPPADETESEKLLRLEKERKEREVSAAIDEEIEQGQAPGKKAKATKILLLGTCIPVLSQYRQLTKVLGQSESGIVTTLCLPSHNLIRHRKINYTQEPSAHVLTKGLNPISARVARTDGTFRHSALREDHGEQLFNST